MRGNSGFLRWLLSSYSWITLNQKLIVGCTLCLMMAASITEAGPVNILRSRRMIRDVYSEFDTQSQNVTLPTAGVCLHDGIGVPKESVDCEMKSGCRAIQKTGYCCPDYQCDCERNGRIYANGEKLVDPEEPCKGCYCQGGEFLCNDVNCYIRHDCEPKFIPGRCCPEYDNCPPIDSSRPAMSSTTQNTVSSTTFSSSEQPTPSSSAPNSALKQPEVVNNNPLGIKIKEITKPEEIRIIDEKPKPVYQLIKPLDSGGANQPKIYAPTAPRIEPIPVLSQIQTVPAVSSNSNSPSNTVEIDDSRVPPNPPSSTTTEPDGEPVKLAVSEISSNIADASTTESAPKFENVEAKLDSDEDVMKVVRHTDSVEMDPIAGEIVSSSTDASSSTSDANSVGKEVVIVDSNGQTKPITVFGVEGLQRGDELDEALEFEEKKSASKRSDSPTISPDSSTTELPGEHTSSTGSELIYENSSSTGGQNDFKTVSEVDPVGSGSDDFIRVAITTRLGESTTEGVIPDDTRHSSTSTEGEVFDTVYQIGDFEGSADVEDSQAHGSVFHTVYREPDQIDQNAAQIQSSTNGPKIGVADLIDDDDEIGVEPNPAYPHISDDISVYQTQVRTAEDDMAAKYEKILPEVLDMLANTTTHLTNGTTESPESWLKNLVNDSATEGVLIDDETALIPQERSPGEPHLIPDWERNSTESIAMVNTSSEESFEEESLLPNGQPTDLDTSPASGDGPSRVSPKNRESTTSNVRKLIDIDEDGSGRLEHDPKDDTESLKYQEDGDGSLAKPYVDTGLRYLVSAIENFRQSNLMDVLRLD